MRRELGDDWPKLIRRLQPDWLVLRRNHAEWFRMNDSALLQSEYQLVRRFDVSAQVAACRFLPGRAYLNADEAFEVFSRVAKRAR